MSTEAWLQVCSQSLNDHQPQDDEGRAASLAWILELQMKFGKIKQAKWPTEPTQVRACSAGPAQSCVSIMRYAPLVPFSHLMSLLLILVFRHTFFITCCFLQLHSPSHLPSFSSIIYSITTHSTLVERVMWWSWGACRGQPQRRISLASSLLFKLFQFTLLLMCMAGM